MTRELLTTYLPWVASVITLGTTWLSGHKVWWAFAPRIVNQFVWFTWIIASETWGFLPMAIILLMMYTRNHLLWRRDAKERAQTGVGASG